MTLLGLALAAFFAGGVAALLATRRPSWSTRFGVSGALLGSALGLVPALQVLGGRDLPALDWPWSVPGGAISLAIDPLSAFFLVPLFVVTAATGLYGGSYLAAEARHKLVGPTWLWFDGLAASQVLVLTARNGLLFLVAWELMALTSYFLVIFHHERPEVPRAGWIYLAATHLGTAFLLVLFGLLASETGSFDFALWEQAAKARGFGWFALALVGFGAKAGLFPLHVWLPEAHPAAPSHVSALLSAVMVKLGIYGLLRSLTLLGPPSLEWGGCLLALGLASGGLGALLVLAQRDLKRLLAYSTVENVGIVSIGLGLAWIGLALDAAPLAVLGLAGGLLHVWNHALFKGALFLCAGSVARGAGTLDLEGLGGLLRRMPWTGAGFLLAAAALVALPPFNGFVSEFVIYAAAFHGLDRSSPAFLAALASVLGLGLVGALAAAGFVRAAGTALLGEPRSVQCARAREVGRSMRLTPLALSLGCLVLGLAGPLLLRALLRPLEQLLGPGIEVSRHLRDAEPALWRISAVGAAVALGALTLSGVRRRLLARRSIELRGTWDCGYAAPSPRMQYGASSFAQPLTHLFSPVLRTRVEEQAPSGAFPGPSAFRTRVADVAEDAFRRLFAGVEALTLAARPLQAGSTHRFILYTVLAALALLLWKLG